MVTSFSSCLHALLNIVKSLPALDSKQIKKLIWLSRTMSWENTFANEIVQSCGKGYETEVTKMGKNHLLAMVYIEPVYALLSKNCPMILFHAIRYA